MCIHYYQFILTQGDLPDKLVHYGEFIIHRDADLPREFHITNMSTLISNSEYSFQVFIE